MNLTAKEVKSIQNEYDKLITAFDQEGHLRVKAMRRGEDSHNIQFRGKMTHKLMGEILGMIMQNYQKIETGPLEEYGTRITIHQLIKLCTVFKCSADYILFGREIYGGQGERVKELEAALDREKALVESLIGRKKKK